MKALDLDEENATIVINRNSSLQELASGLNVQPVLERLFTSMEYTVGLAAARAGMFKWSISMQNMDKYIDTRLKCHEQTRNHRASLRKVCN